jgi:transcriptional regulator with XRE-family HTH domain
MPKSKRSPDPIDAEVGRRIRLLRLERGLSQTALANRLGVTFQQVQKYEKGTNRVGAGRLSRIAYFLGVPVSAFFGNEKISKEQSASPGSVELGYLVVPGALRLVKAYSAIRDGDIRKALVELAEATAAGKK